MPARTEPVIATSCGIGCSTSARPVSRSPVTTLKTPGGRNSWHISANSVVEAGVVSDGLEHDRVAGGEGRPDLPDHHHQRVVPGRHLADDADRLASYEGGVVLEVLAGRLALEHPGRAGEEPELVDRRRQLLVDRERRAACRCRGTRPRRTPRARFSSASAILSSARCRSEGVVSPQRLERLARRPGRRGRRPRRRTSGRWRRPPRCSGRRRRRSPPTPSRPARRR